MSYFILLSFLFFSLSLASPLTRRVNQNEHVILANCLDKSGHKYSEMAYYSDIPQPSITPLLASVNLPDNTFASWESSRVSATFADGNTFTANVLATPVGGYAGPGSNSYGGFNCFYQPVHNMYVDGPGTPFPLDCSGVYDCSHAPIPVPVSAANPLVSAFFDNSLAQFDGTGATLVDFFHPVFQHMSATACDGLAVDIPNTGSALTGAPDCTITFQCNGDGDGRMAQALAKTLVQIVGQLPDVLRYEDVAVTPVCLQNGAGAFSSECAVWSPSTKTVTYIMSHARLDITGYYESGSLEYQIKCPAPPQCSPCDLTEQQFALPSNVPVLRELFGISGLLSSGSCVNNLCAAAV